MIIYDFEVFKHDTLLGALNEETGEITQLWNIDQIREFTEKNLNKGELRPEIAYLICSFSDIHPNENILEPFCGYGSIPIQLVKKFHFNHLFACDIDEHKISLLKEKKQLQNKDSVNVCQFSQNLTKNYNKK